MVLIYSHFHTTLFLLEQVRQATAKARFTLKMVVKPMFLCSAIMSAKVFNFV